MARNTARNRNPRNAVKNRYIAKNQRAQNEAAEQTAAEAARAAEDRVAVEQASAETQSNQGVGAEMKNMAEVIGTESSMSDEKSTSITEGQASSEGEMSMDTESTQETPVAAKASADRPINQATAAQAAAHALGMGLRMRRMMTGKIHRVTVTGADLHYVGSITIDADLLDGADILPGQEVDVVDITNGARLTTYAIPGERGSGIISINGAAAHLINEGDLAIVISYSLLDEASCRGYEPRVVFVDEKNRPIEVSGEPGQAPAGADVVSSGISFGEYRG